MSIAIKDGKVTQTWTGDERPTPDPDPEPEVTVVFDIQIRPTVPADRRPEIRRLCGPYEQGGGE